MASDLPDLWFVQEVRKEIMVDPSGLVTYQRGGVSMVQSLHPLYRPQPRFLRVRRRMDIALSQMTVV